MTPRLYTYVSAPYSVGVHRVRITDVHPSGSVNIECVHDREHVWSGVSMDDLAPVEVEL